MRVLVAGSSGLIGSALLSALHAAGHEVRRLVRRPQRTEDESTWDPTTGHIADGAFDGVDAVVNLCGSSLIGLWTAGRKRLLRESRITPTALLAAEAAEHGVKVLVNASAIGFYGNAGAEVVDERAPNGKGFLAQLCADWEQATWPAVGAGTRVVTLRTGLVLAHGGLLGLLRPMFKAGLGGRIGDGSQYMPWIHIDDHVAAVRFLLDHDDVAGPVNVCAPAPATNAEFTRALAGALRRPAPWVAPTPVLRLVLRQAADEMLLTSQNARPAVLEHHGFRFRHPDLDEALKTALMSTS